MSRSFSFHDSQAQPRASLYRTFAQAIPFSPAARVMRGVCVEMAMLDPVLMTKLLENLVARDELAFAIFQAYGVSDTKYVDEIPF